MGRMARLPWGLLGMVALVVATEGLLARTVRERETTASACWRHSGALARQARDVKVLCLGTSLVKTGLLPWAIEARTGRRASNLAVFSGPVPASYFLLRRVLSAGARPSAVVVDCQNLALPGASREDQVEALLMNTRAWADLLDVRECLDLAWSARDPDFFARTMLARALPTARARFEVRAAILAGFRGQGDSSRELIASFLRNWTVNRGAHVFPAGGRPPSRFEAPAVVPPGAVAPDDRLLDTVAGRYAARLVALAESRGASVFWLLPPLPPKVQAERASNGEDACLVRLARTLQARSRHMVVIDGRSSGYERGAFADAVHLDRIGASILSDGVAALLARYFRDPSSVPPWVTLPPYRDAHPPGLFIEDFKESMLAVRASRSIR